MTIRVAVFGAGGRMGAEVCRAVVGDSDLELVAAVDPHHAGLDLRQVASVDVPIQLGAGAEELVRARPDVAVDFTQLDASRQNLSWLADHGVHAVVGTTGFTEADYERFEKTFTSSNCVIAPNFAIGAVLMMRFAEIAAPYFDSAEIIELHHDNKIDAPSGTAMHTAELMAAAGGRRSPDPTTNTVLDGARGGRAAGDIPIHSVRLRGLVAHQEVLLGTTGQMLTIRHDTTDRTSFMPGVLLAIKAVGDRPGVTIGLEPLLDL